MTGIVDWELSTPLPFGMGFCRIHTLAGEYAEQEFYMPPHFEDAERAFWQEIDHHLPDHVRTSFHADPEATQIAVTLGTLLDTFQLDEGKIGPMQSCRSESSPNTPYLPNSSSPGFIFTILTLNHPASPNLDLLRPQPRQPRSSTLFLRLDLHSRCLSSQPGLATCSSEVIVALKL